MFKCTVCGKTIENADFSYCTDCGKTFCENCKKNSVICPSCNGNITKFQKDYR